MKTLVELAQESLGKTLTIPESNLCAKLEAEYAVKPTTTEAQSVQNRFGFGSALVSPLTAALVAFVYGCETGFGPVTYRGKKVPIAIFDRTRYLVLKLDGAAYSALLD
jgi:hypothetical protein